MTNVLILADSRDLDKEHIALTEYLTRHCGSLDADKYIFVLPGQGRKSSMLHNAAQAMGNGATLISVNDTQGTACTALWAVGHINNDDELLILSDMPPDIDATLIVQDFRARGLRAGVALRPAIFGDGLGIESGKSADGMELAGFFWFARGRDFVETAQNIIRRNNRIGGFLDLASIYDELLRQKMRLGSYSVDEGSDVIELSRVAVAQRRLA